MFPSLGVRGSHSGIYSSEGFKALRAILGSECGWKLEDAVEHLRGITALACGNPYLIEAVAKFLKVDANVPLNPAGDDGRCPRVTPKDPSPLSCTRTNHIRVQSALFCLLKLRIPSIHNHGAPKP